jgi:hypothetical protein
MTINDNFIELQPLELRPFSEPPTTYFQYPSTHFNLSSTIRDRRRGAQTIVDWLEQLFLLYRGIGLKDRHFII